MPLPVHETAVVSFSVCLGQTLSEFSRAHVTIIAVRITLCLRLANDNLAEGHTVGRNLKDGTLWVLTGRLRQKTCTCRVLLLVVELDETFRNKRSFDGEKRAYLNVVPIDQVANLFVEAKVSLILVHGRRTEPRRNGSVGNHVLTSR